VGLAVTQDHHGEGLHQRLHRDLADEGPFAGADLDESGALQGPERLPHRGAADPEALGQVPLGRQAVA
jgi:hypothetical protein